MVKVFVSYRRQDSAQVTGRIYDKLVASFGTHTVFKDVDSIPLGSDFRRILEKSIANCDVILVVMGLKWSGAPDQQGQARIHDTSDYVRIEIENALQKNLPIIPLLVDEANMPAAEALPESIRDVVFRNATKIRPDPDFHRDMDRVIDAIRRHEPMTVALAEPSTENTLRRRAQATQIAEVLPVFTVPEQPPATTRPRWTRLHNAIAGAICAGSFAVPAALCSKSLRGSDLAEAIPVSLIMGLLTSIPGAIGGAVANSRWAWIVVLAATLLLGSFGFLPRVNGGMAENVTVMAWMGCWLGWFLVIGIAVVKALIRRLSPPTS
jgi:hypothetical protein